MMKKLLTFALLIFVSSSVYAQKLPPVQHAPNREFHMTHLKLQLQFNMSQKSVTGEATETIVPLRMPLDSLHLNAVDMKIRSIQMNGKSLKYRYNGNILTIALGHPYGLTDTLTYSIDYYTQPKRGLTFITPDKGYPKRSPEVWSQSEMEDARYWYPCHDYPDDFSTSEMIVTVPESWKVISNGALKNVKTLKSKHEKVFHWVESKPHVVYLNSVIAGKFNKFETNFGKIPIYFYSDPKYGDKIKRNFSKEPDILKFYANYTGVPYPWEKLAVTTVSNFIWGGEENVTAITLEDGTLHGLNAEPQVNSTSLIAHESAHQWFGDMITCRSWAQSWLNEGFATYFEALYTRHYLGKTAFRYEMYHNHQAAIRADNRHRQPTVYHRYHAPVDMFNTYIYQRGASMLHMLRGFLGNALFRKAIHHYAEKFKFQNADTHDFANAIREATGYNMNWFFKEWLYKGGHPVFDVHYKYDDSHRTVTMQVNQVQKVDSLTPVYKMPVNIQIVTPEGKMEKKIWIKSKRNTYTFKNIAEQPLMVNFDQGHWLLDEVHFQKPVTELEYQLKHDQDVVGRLWAANQLSGINNQGVINALAQALKNDPFYGVRERCAHLLAHYHRDASVKNELITAAKDSDKRVQAAVLSALGHFNGNDLVRMMEQQYSKRKNYYIRAVALFLLAEISPKKSRSYIRKALQTPSHSNVIRLHALRALTHIDKKWAYREAVKFSAYGEPNNLRVPAVSALISLEPGKQETLQLLKKYLNDPYIWVRSDAIYGLGRIGDRSAIPLLEKRIKVEPDGRIRQAARQAIQMIQSRN